MSAEIRSLKGVAWKNLYVGSVVTPDVAEKLYEALCKLKAMKRQA